MTDIATTPPTQPIIKRFNKKQKAFIQNWLEPESETFGNAYQSAIKAGYSKNASRVITGDAKGLEWVQQAKQLYASALTPEHVYKGVQQIALNTRADRDKLAAYALMAKWNGMEITRTQSDVNIQFVNSVPRPIIDLIQADDAPIQSND